MSLNILWGEQPFQPTPSVQPKEREVKMAARGKFAWQLIDKGEAIYTEPFKSNFIFDWGLDQVASMTWARCFEYCRIGNVAVGSLQTSSGRNGLGQYSLQAEVAASNTYFVGVLPAPFSFSGCASSGISGSGVLMRRTFDFNPEVGTQIYSEIGWSPAVAGNLFSRVIATSGGQTGVTVLEGQSIRVIYELEVYLGPSGQFVSNPITGWNSSGTMGIQLFGVSSVGSTGQSQFYDAASGSNEPSCGARAFISDNGTALAPLGSDIDRTTANTYEANTTMFAYTNGTYTRRKRFFIAANTGIYTGFRSVGIGQSGAGAIAADNNSFVHIFSTPVSKEVDYILNLNFYYTWGRLSNT